MYSREFVRLLIGAKLSSKLDFSVHHYCKGTRENWLDHSLVYYTVFGMSFDTPISFEWYSNSQLDTQEGEIYPLEENE